MKQNLSLFKKFGRIGLMVLMLVACGELSAAVNNPNNPNPPKTPGTGSGSGSGSGGGSNSNCNKGPNNNCVSFAFSFPIFPLESKLGAQTFNIERQDPTPGLFSPQSLSYSSILTTYVVSITSMDDLPDGVSHQFEIANLRNEKVLFEVPEGESLARTAGTFAGQTTRVQLLDGDLNPTTIDPQFYRLLSGDGSKVDYPVQISAGPERFVSIEGRIIEINDAVEFLLKDGFYRQLRCASGLADIVVVDDFSYELRLHAPGNEGTKDTDGYYVPVGSPYRVIRIENPTGNLNFYESVRITDTQGAYSRISEWNYVPAADDWALTEGIDPMTGAGMLTEQIIISEDAETGNELRTIELRGVEGGLVSRKRQVIAEKTWGSALIQEIEDVDGFALSTAYTFYEDEAERGRYGQRSTQTNPDGSWARYDYDSEGRLSRQIDPWQDSPPSSTAAQAKETVYAYTPVDTSDVGADAFDSRARTTIVKVLGVETGRTYNAYFIDSVTGEYTEIEERTTVQGAAYGASTNLRTTRVYYADTADAASAGRLRSVTTPDAVVMEYAYAQVDAQSNFIETVDRVTVAGPLAFKSTREVMTKDPRNNMILKEQHVHDGTDWQLYSTTTQVFSDEISSNGFQLETRVKDGRTVLDQSWFGALVGGRTDESGIETIMAYDLLDRLETEIKVGANGSPDITTTYDRDLGAIDCGCDGSRSMERSSGGISITSVAKTDTAGRSSEMTDENGYITTYSYVDDERITTMNMPSGSTRITENYLDGRVESVTGTGVIPEYYNYWINPDGTQTTRIKIASEGSPRYREMTYDVAGRLIREESPNSVGGTFVQTMEYNSLGLLAKQTETGRAATLYEYDALAGLIRTGLDVNGDDALVPASNDRITDVDRFMEQDGAGDWFEISTTTVYPEDNSATTVEVNRTARRMSNFPLAGMDGDLVSEVKTTDVHGEVTTSVTTVDRSTKTMLQTTEVPDSTILGKRTMINGLLVSENSTTVAAPMLYTYDAVERRVGVKDPRHAQAAQITYYANTLQVFEQIDAAGNATTFTYVRQGQNGAGQVASITDALLQKSYLEYDALDRQIRSWGETDYPQEYSYSIYGELSTLTTWRDPSIDFSTDTWPGSTSGDTTTWTYDAASGLLTRKEYADGKGTDYAYDSANRLAVRTWARDGGLDTTYGYDSTTSELLTVDYEDASTADLSYTYDRLGRQKTVTDATGTRSFSYDSANLLLDTENFDTTFYDGHTLTRAYENGTETNGRKGRIQGYSLANGGTSFALSATYAYENTGRLSTVSDGTDTFTYTYLTNSNLLASCTAPQHTVTHSYEANRDLMTLVDNQASGSSLSGYSYTHDALGRRISRQQSGSAYAQANTDTFSYNTRSEVEGSSNDLLTATEFASTYSYDQIGNRLSASGGVLGAGNASYTSNALNQYATISSINPVHDDDGNLTDNGTWTYSWDNENRLVTATDGSTTINFLYDYQGRLVKKDDGTDVEVYLYDGWNRIASFDVGSSTFDVQRSYLWGMDLSGSMQGAGGVGGLLKEGSLYPTYDANGNIMQKLDGTGATVMSVDYDPFGNVISGTLSGEYGFSTKPLMEDVEFYYYGFRYYDPVTGRWSSRDPIQEEGGNNLHAFVINSSLNFFDLIGLQRQCTNHSFSGSYNLHSIRHRIITPVGPFVVRGRARIRVQFSGQQCTECCDGVESDTYSLSGNIFVEAAVRVTWGIDEDESYGRFTVRIWAGIQAEITGGVNANASISKTCSGEARDISFNVSSSGLLQGGAQAQLVLGNWRLANTGVTVGGNVNLITPVNLSCDDSGCSTPTLGRSSGSASVFARACLLGYCVGGSTSINF
ncbi:MAG: RHS repeat-associated core domain-containing protein [Verrucomicrobiota bacterium]